MKIAIIADDLTGACDSIAPFANHGLRCGVVADYRAADQSVASSYDAIAITIETRDLHVSDGNRIADTVGEAVQWTTQILKPDILFKKIDSTLRGHLGAELVKMLDDLPQHIALVCPAFPSMGRTVVGGMLEVALQPKLGGSALEPISVRDAFGNLGGHETALLSRNAIRQGAYHVADRVCEMERDGVSVIFCDAESDEDLRTLASMVVENPDRYLPVGSGGLSRSIAAHLAAETRKPGESESHRSDAMSRPVVVLVGSQNPVSRMQAAFLENALQIRRVFTLGEAADHIRSGSRVALAITPKEQQEGACTPQNLLAIKRCSISDIQGITIMATGGATAMAVLGQFGKRSQPIIEVCGEMEPGVVLCRIRPSVSVASEARTTYLIVKAGGFGDEQTLFRCTSLIP